MVVEEVNNSEEILLKKGKIIQNEKVKLKNNNMKRKVQNLLISSANNSWSFLEMGNSSNSLASGIERRKLIVV